MRTAKDLEIAIYGGMFAQPGVRGVIEGFVKEFNDELETERMRLTACGVAAMRNIDEGVVDRVGKDHPYYSASYGDVCRAVDREMRYRTALQKIICNEGISLNAYADRAQTLAQKALEHNIGSTDTYIQQAHEKGER